MLSAITAAVVGVILNLAIWFAVHTIFRETVPIRVFFLSFDAPILASVAAWALALLLAAAIAIFWFKARMMPHWRGVVLPALACTSQGNAVMRGAATISPVSSVQSSPPARSANMASAL